MLLDKDIREPLFDFLEESYGKTRFFQEKMMGGSRADVVMVTLNHLYGIEIKSDADSYTRLKSQVRDYELYYDRNIIVVGTSHAMHIEEHVPEHWGIITVEETDAATDPEGKSSADFYILRKPKDNPCMDTLHKLMILWRPEISLIQNMNGMPAYSGNSKLDVIKKIAERTEAFISMKSDPECVKITKYFVPIDPEELRKQICSVLFERDYDSIGDTIAQYRKDHGKKRQKSGAQGKRTGIRRARRRSRRLKG